VELNNYIKEILILQFYKVQQIVYIFREQCLFNLFYSTTISYRFSSIKLPLNTVAFKVFLAIDAH